MIRDILQEHDEIGFKKVMDLIYHAKPTDIKNQYKVDSSGKFQKDHLGDPQKLDSYYQIEISDDLYLNHLNSCELCDYDGNPFNIYIDRLDVMLNSLIKIGAIKDFYHVLHNNPDYDERDYILDHYQNTFDNSIDDNAPDIKLVRLYFEKGGTVLLDLDLEKFKLFYDIIYKKKAYICKLGTLRGLMALKTNLDIESFLDWIQIDEKYIFDDYEVLLCSIASSSRLNLAKMYYYFSKHVFEADWSSFLSGPFDFETEVVKSNSANFDEGVHVDGYQCFWFNSSKDHEFEGKNMHIEKVITSGHTKYDFEKNLLQVGEKNISFKGSKKQKDLLELLLNNSSRHISSSETEKIGVADMKITLDDLKNKLKDAGIPKLQMKQLFNYFEEDGIKYCRILL